MQNKEKALTIIADILDIDSEKLALETVVKEIPSWDSMAFLTIIAQLDEEFVLKTSVEQVIGELVNAKTIDDLLHLLRIRNA